jgi:WD40 repeat protein
MLNNLVTCREKLAEQLRSTFELDEVSPDDHVEIPDNRLVNLLHQAVAYQMEFSRYHPKTIPKVSTLLRNFECEILPNCVKSTYVGHSQNVKYVTFVGHEGEYLASGSSDNKIKVWPVELPLLRAKSSNIETSGDICSVSRDLRGHTSRIWYMCSNNGGDMLYSASGDGTVKIWSLKNALTDLISSSDGSHSISSAKPHGISNSALTPSNDCVSTLQGHSGDIYSVS